MNFVGVRFRGVCFLVWVKFGVGVRNVFKDFGMGFNNVMFCWFSFSEYCVNDVYIKVDIEDFFFWFFVW